MENSASESSTPGGSSGKRDGSRGTPQKIRSRSSRGLFPNSVSLNTGTASRESDASSFPKVSGVARQPVVMTPRSLDDPLMLFTVAGISPRLRMRKMS